MEEIPCENCGSYYSHKRNCIKWIDTFRERLNNLEEIQINSPKIYALEQENQKLKEQLAKAHELIEYFRKDDCDYYEPLAMFLEFLKTLEEK